MTARFISSIIALIVLLGCHSNGAYSYNQYIVAKEKQIGVHTDEAVRRFNIFSKSDNYDSLTILSQERCHRAVAGQADGRGFKTSTL